MNKKSNENNKYRNETRSDTASFFGVSTRTIDRWVKSGFPRKTNGRYSLPECAAWRTDQLSMAAGAGEPTSPQLERFRKLRADLLQLELDEREERLVSYKDVMAGWCSRHAMMRDALLSLPHNLPPLLEGCSQPEIRRKLEAEAMYILESFVKNGKYTPREAVDAAEPENQGHEGDDD